MKSSKTSIGSRAARALAFGCLILLAALGAPAAAQSPPDGCTLPGLSNQFPTLGPVLQQAADIAFLGACTAHDSCYRSCAILDSLPFHYAHKADCDIEFFARLHGECLGLTAIASQVDPDASDDFFAYCEAAAGSLSILVSIFGESAYFEDQCTHCNCYTEACTQALYPPNWNCLYCPPWDPYCGGYCPPWDPWCGFQCRYPYDPFCNSCPYWDPWCYGGCPPWDPWCGWCSPWDPWCGGGCSPWDFYCPFYPY